MGKIVNIIVDTGCSSILIDKKFIGKLLENRDNKLTFLKTVGNHKVSTLGRTLIFIIELNNIEFEVTKFVVKNLPNLIILDVKILEREKANIDLKKKQISLKMPMHRLYLIYYIFLKLQN